jgi:O-antigen/teichoic acid export membrane protein
MLGLGLPLIAAVFAIPVLIQDLGEARFGILTLIWAVVSYFGLFDLGLGRAVTQRVAVAIANERREELDAIVGTSSAMLLVLGVCGGIVMLIIAPTMGSQLASGNGTTEVVEAFWWMAAAMPAIVLTSGYRGILEATGQFALVNMIRVPMGIFTFAGPLLALTGKDTDLSSIAAILALGRIVACVVHGWFATRSTAEVVGLGSFDHFLIGSLLKFGGWLSVSNIISPLMNYIDRFLIGVTLSASAVAYYATPQELILRIGIIPGAVAAVLFPMFAASRSNKDPLSQSRQVVRYSIIIGALIAPLTIILLLFAHPILSLWISDAFADNAASILQIFSIAALASGLAQVPFTMLQSKGRADVTAIVHVVECPLYIALLYYMMIEYGPVGAAWAWLIRIAGDMAVLYWLNFKFYSRDVKCSVNI